MKIVLVKHVEYDFKSVRTVDEDGDFVVDDDYIQASEIIDVEFPMIEIDVTAAKINIINRKIAQAEVGISLLQDARSELLALPNMGTE